MATDGFNTDEGGVAVASEFPFVVVDVVLDGNEQPCNEFTAAKAALEVTSLTISSISDGMLGEFTRGGVLHADEDGTTVDATVDVGWPSLTLKQAAERLFLV